MSHGGSSTASFIALFIFFAQGCGNAQDSPYYKFTGNPIPGLASESVPWRTSTDPASSATYLVAGEVENVVAWLRGVVDQRFGEVEAKEAMLDLNARMQAALGGSPEWQVRWDALRARGMSLDGLRRVTLKSSLYNRQPDIHGSSQLEATVTDASRLLRCSCVIVALARTDRWRAWGREFHTGLPVPFKLGTEAYVVTSTETDLIKGMRGLRGGPIFAKLWWEPLLDVDVLDELASKADGSRP